MTAAAELPSAVFREILDFAAANGFLFPEQRSEMSDAERAAPTIPAPPPPLFISPLARGTACACLRGCGECDGTGTIPRVACDLCDHRAKRDAVAVYFTGEAVCPQHLAECEEAEELLALEDAADLAEFRAGVLGALVGVRP